MFIFLLAFVFTVNTGRFILKFRIGRPSILYCLFVVTYFTASGLASAFIAEILPKQNMLKNIHKLSNTLTKLLFLITSKHSSKYFTLILHFIRFSVNTNIQYLNEIVEICKRRFKTFAYFFFLLFFALSLSRLAT